MPDKIALRDVFAKLPETEWFHVVYLPTAAPALDTLCLVLDPDDVELEEDCPPEARKAGFLEGLLSVADIQDIENNAIQQNRKPTPEEMLQAFSYYLRNDAFIEFD